ncbi:MAG: PQQ-like beta-propeller repeat protein [Methylococcaceae bacterium]|nr:PQQ-like beta-propeller repeat protein [Methylococcaceae bacterium]
MACQDFAGAEQTPALKRIFPKHIDERSGLQSNIYASPILDLSGAEPRILAAYADGTITALHPKTGATVWRTALPAPENHTIILMATPVIVRDLLVATYQAEYHHKRQSHRVAVIRLPTGRLDPRFPVVELAAEKSLANGSATVAFNPGTELSHSDLVHAMKAGSQRGYVYVAFGNGGDIQPFHGWLFEMDLDNWLQQGAAHAISSTLLTTPETYCPEEGKTGSRDMICGGGIWTPAGPQLVQNKHDYELILPIGNGQFDLKRKDYAGTLMRVRQGLEFDPGCNAEICEDFDVTRDPQAADLACMASCRNLFIPRLMPGDPPLRPASGNCDNKSFWECVMWSDYDLGASAPARVTLSNGLTVLVQPGKEGGLYLLDAAQLGVLYDRQQIVPVCGTPDDPCIADWAGMVITQPAVTMIDGVPLVIVATFIPDKSHAAGLLAYKILLKQNKPYLRRVWQAPDPGSKEALRRFRWNPGRPVLAPFGASGEIYAWVVDTGERGTLLGVRLRDGAIINRTSLLGTGRPHTKPLIYDGVIYVPSNHRDRTRSWLEAYEMVESR